jgi:hypothetical protein
MAVGPYDFSLNIPDPGQAFMQSFDAARQRRDQMAQQENRQVQLQQFMGRLRQDRSPQMMAEFAMAFPEMAQAVTKAYEPLDAQVRQSRLQQQAEVYTALERGDTARAKEIAQDLLEAARNTPGQEQFIKDLEYGIETIDSNPDALKAGLATSIYMLDPNLYKERFASQDMKLDTSLIKNLVAEMGPEAIGTPEFKQALKEERTKITITDPRIGFFSGPAEEFRRRYGGEPPATAQRGSLPSPKSKAEFDALPAGTMFKDPNGMIRTKPGGGSGNATGGFRAEGN